jgi:hypothetical protein
MLATKALSAALSKKPVYIEDVFGTTLHRGPAADYNSTVLPVKNKVLTTNSVDPDWQHVKRSMPLAYSNSYDAVTGTHLGGPFVGGAGYSGPFGNAGVVAYSAQETANRSGGLSQPSGADYNAPWCIEGWVFLLASGSNYAATYIHSSSSAQNNGIEFYAYSSGATARLFARIRSGGSTIISWDVSIPGFQWVFCSLSYDGTDIKLHINGTQSSSAAFGGFASQPTHTVIIGAQTEYYDEDDAYAFFCHYRATFGTARAATRTVVPTRPFPVTGGDPNCENAALWVKSRATGNNHLLNVDAGTSLMTDNTTGFGTFSGGPNSMAVGVTDNSVIFQSTTVSNTPNTDFVMWAFTKAQKFFDIVTYTGNGSNRTIAHDLGSVPGCIILRRVDAAASWQVYHRGLANTEYMVLNSTAAKATGATRWNSTTPTDSVFSLGTDASVNANGGKYVAYIFAHDAGGFGESGADNVISCGSVTTPGTSVITDVNLGWEPQWILLKNTTNASEPWYVVDSMRRMTDSASSPLLANNANAESTAGGVNGITATGFSLFNREVGPWIYIAIRRGPMKKPTSGVEVYNAIARTGTGAAAAVTGVGFSPDLVMSKNRNQTNRGTGFFGRLVGTGRYTQSDSTAAEVSAATSLTSFDMNGVSVGSDGAGGLINQSSYTYANWFLRRAPGFFDVVCYTGTGTTNIQSHSLGVPPELAIFKSRSDTSSPWPVLHVSTSKYLQLNLDSSSPFNFTLPVTATTVNVTSNVGNNPGVTHVAYLFATLPGVSKVGSYTGTGTTLQINCGFTGGARFVLIKRTDSTGDWYVWDTARGIVSGNDPYLLINSTAAEVTSTDYIDPYAAGFEISSTAPAAINASGGSFIFLAIA